MHIHIIIRHHKLSIRVRPSIPGSSFPHRIEMEEQHEGVGEVGEAEQRGGRATNDVGGTIITMIHNICSTLCIHVGMLVVNLIVTKRID